MEKCADHGEPKRPFIMTTAAPVNYCIYCGSGAGLSKEHVVPYFLAGSLTLPMASCADCADITKRFENDLAYSIFFALRRRLNLQSRKKGGQKKHPLLVNENGQDVERLVAFDELPPIVPWPVFQRPAVFTGGTPSNQIQGFTFRVANIARLCSGPFLDGKFSVDVDLHSFMRLMAKVAHGALFARDRIERWEPILQEAVRFGQFLSFYVGGADEQVVLPEIESPPSNGATLEPLQRIWTYVTRLPQDTSNEYLVTVIEPLSLALCPRYEVVTARRAIQGESAESVKREMCLPPAKKRQFKSDRMRIHIEAKMAAEEAQFQDRADLY